MQMVGDGVTDLKNLKNWLFGVERNVLTSIAHQCCITRALFKKRNIFVSSLSSSMEEHEEAFNFPRVWFGLTLAIKLSGTKPKHNHTTTYNTPPPKGWGLIGVVRQRLRMGWFKMASIPCSYQKMEQISLSPNWNKLPDKSTTSWPLDM